SGAVAGVLVATSPSDAIERQRVQAGVAVLSWRVRVAVLAVNPAEESRPTRLKLAALSVPVLSLRLSPVARAGCTRSICSPGSTTATLLGSENTIQPDDQSARPLHFWPSA